MSQQKADETAGFPSREGGRDPISGLRGSNQNLTEAAAHHDGDSTLGPDGNRIPARSRPLWGGEAKPGKPSAVHPAGHGLGQSYDGGGE